MIAPRRRFIAQLHILPGVVGNIVANLVLPRYDARFARFNIEQPIVGSQFFQIADIFGFKIGECEQSANERILVASPFEWVLSARIRLCASVDAGAQSVVVVVGNEEELIVERVGGVEVDVIIVGIVPIVVPHAHCHIHGVGFEQ